MVSGIPPSVWADEGEQTIATAIAILNERQAAPPETGQEAPTGWELQSV